MTSCQYLAIDVAKNIFQLHGTAADGSVAFRRRLARDQLSEFVVQLPACDIAMEACASAHHWARQFVRMGHRVRLISPQFVKPFVKGNKNDGNDAEAICEAMQRPSMRFVPIKSVAQQDIQSLHRIRSRLVNERTGLVCQIRGILAERGIVFAKSITRARREFPVIAQDLTNPLTPTLRTMMSELIEELRALDERVRMMEPSYRSGVSRRRSLSAYLPHRGRRSQDSDCHCGCGRRSARVQEWAPLCGLARVGTPSAFQRRPGAFDGNHQARGQVPSNTTGPRRASGTADSAEEERSKASMGLTACRQTRRCEGHRRHRQQDGTGHLGAASEKRGVPSSDLKRFCKRAVVD